MNYLQKRDNLFFMFLIILLSYIHGNWIFSLDILADGDFFYIPIQALKTIRADYFSTWLSDFEFWRAPIDLSQAFVWALPWYFAKFFNWDFAIWERISYFLPILFFSVCGTYKLFNYLFKEENLSAYLSIFIYLFNTYVLVLQTWHITLACAYAIFPLAFYYFCKGVGGESKRDISLSAFIFVLLGFYETRMLFVSWIILLIYVIIFYKKISIWNLIIFWGILLGLNIFRLIPLKYIGLDSQNVLWRSLFGVWYRTVENALTIHHSWWHLDWVKVFEAVHSQWFLFVFPAILLILEIVKRKELFKNKYFLFSIIVLILGVFLWKSANPPFGDIYLWMYENIPFFNAFREPTKFYLLLALWYSLSLGYAVWLVKNIHIKKLISLSVLSVCWLNLLVHYLYNPQLLKTKNIPLWYEELNRIINEDSFYSRVLWLPRYSNRGTYSFIHPLLNGINEWAIEKVYKNSRDVEIFQWYDFYKRIKTFFESTMVSEYLKVMNAKYIVLDRNMIKDYWLMQDPEIFDKYYQLLGSLTWYSEVWLSGTNDLKLFKRDSSVYPHILWRNNLTFFSEGHTQYNIITTLYKDQSLYFMESYHPWWKLFLNKYHKVACENVKGYKGKVINNELFEQQSIGHINDDWLVEKYEVIECEMRKGLNIIWWFKKIISTPLFDQSHKRVYSYANGRTLDADYIKKNFTKEYYKENPDGSIDVNLTLYFKPQSYFYVGLWVSGVTLLILLFLLAREHYLVKNNEK